MISRDYITGFYTFFFGRRFDLAFLFFFRIIFGVLVNGSTILFFGFGIFMFSGLRFEFRYGFDDSGPELTFFRTLSIGF